MCTSEVDKRFPKASSYHLNDKTFSPLNDKQVFILFSRWYVCFQLQKEIIFCQLGCKAKIELKEFLGMLKILMEKYTKATNYIYNAGLC